MDALDTLTIFLKDITEIHPGYGSKGLLPIAYSTNGLVPDDTAAQELSYFLLERCEAMEPPSTVLAAIARLVPWNWKWGPPPAGVGLSCGLGGECECGAALAELRALTRGETEELPCHMADAITQYYSAHGLNDTKWTAETLAADHLRQQKLSQLLHAVRRITRALYATEKCLKGPVRITGGEAGTESFRKAVSTYWRLAARLLPLLATHLSQLLIPLAFEHMGNHTNGQPLRGWIKNVERVGHLLDTKFRGLSRDAQLISEQTHYYKVEEDKETPGKYVIRLPLLNEGLLAHQEDLLSFQGDFGALCEQQLPHASQVFGLAGALYSFYRRYLRPVWNITDTIADIKVEKWQLEDQSNTTVWVDTGCLQLLADALDHPRCPLGELPLEASRQRSQCREQLWRDLVERPPRPPVTSYLAYNERAAVSLCLLAWMAANSRGFCQDVPFSIFHSTHDARCYFDRPANKTCLKSNTTDAICSFSRAILLLKCRDFSSSYFTKICYVDIQTTGQYSEKEDVISKDGCCKVIGRATEQTLSYKESLIGATLKYKFTLQPLEYSFIAVNILFRLMTASVYMWLPHLGNLPGKIHLSFQLTGLAQVLCSQVLYRMVGFPDVSTAVLVDSSLTLLACLWLNTFCYRFFACVRHLRLPNDLLPAEVSIVFRRQIRRALTPWTIVCAACAALETSSKYYLIYSRITFIVAIASSIAFNLVLIGLVVFMYLFNKKAMMRLKIIGDDKGFTKKHLIALSVNTIIMSGICVIIRIGFHQTQCPAQYVYYVHMATMLQGPLLFVCFICNATTFPVLRKRLLALWRPDVYRAGLEQFSAVVRNLARRRGGLPPAANSPL